MSLKEMIVVFGIERALESYNQAAFFGIVAAKGGGRLDDHRTGRILCTNLLLQYPGNLLLEALGEKLPD